MSAEGLALEEARLNMASATSTAPSGISKLPPELLGILVRLIYLDNIPLSAFRTIDPFGLPSAKADGRRVSRSHTEVRRTLYNLCLVNRAFYHQARILLFRRIQITLPFSFMLLLRTLGASHLAAAYDHYSQTGEVNADPEDPASFTSMVAAAGFARAAGQRLIVSVATPSESRSASRTRQAALSKERGMSPGRRIQSRVKLASDEDGEFDLVWTEHIDENDAGTETARYHVTLRQFDDDQEDISPVHRWLRILDFANFRTQGMRRTIGDGGTRFVTPGRLLALITAAEGLVAFGASETMDSALSLEVLEALLFRNGDLARPSKLRGVSVERHDLSSHRHLQSLDLCNCISPLFEQGLRAFVSNHLQKFSGRLTSTVPEESGTGSSQTSEDDEDDDERGRGRAPRGRDSRNVTQTRSISTHRDASTPSLHPARPTRFPSLQRLCLSGVTFEIDILGPFVLSFPRLSHLDLSGTKVDAAFLESLGASTTLQLDSLSLARCRRLTSESICDFLIDSSVADSLTELSLEGSLIFPTPITLEDMRLIMTQAPCFRSGRLRYLDLGGCPLIDSHLLALTPQPSLLDLGLSSCPYISLEAVAQTLRQRAPNVQIIELSESCTEPRLVEQGATARVGPISAIQLQSVLIGPCTSLPPLSISQQLSILGIQARHGTEAADQNTDPSPHLRRGATNLRVVGLDSASLASVRAGLGSWRVIWGKGQRGWVVDTSAGPHPDVLDEDFSGLDPWGTSAGTSSGGERMTRSGSSQGGASHTYSRSPVRPLPFQRITSMRRAASLSGRPAPTTHSGSRSRSRPAARRVDPPEEAGPPRNEVIRDLPKGHPRRTALEALSDAKGNVAGDVGWHARKMEVLLGYGLLGRESGSYGFASYQ